jgi:hypothetical protein
MTLMAIPGGQIVGAIGLALVAIGYIYKIISGKDPIERFFQHCSWGDKFGQKGSADWSPTRFEDWKSDRDKEFDQQLVALLNIICKIDISWNDTFRNLQYKLGWVPPGAKLLVSYQETWKKPTDSKELQAEVQFSPTGVASSFSTEFQLTQKDKYTLQLAVLSSAMPRSSSNQAKKLFKLRLPEEGLERVEAKGRLLVSFDGTGTFSIPHQDWQKKTLLPF